MDAAFFLATFVAVDLGRDHDVAEADVVLERARDPGEEHGPRPEQRNGLLSQHRRPEGALSQFRDDDLIALPGELPGLEQRAGFVEAFL
jgi:hypothetical protein